MTIDALMCEHHFNVAAGTGGANSNYFIYCWVTDNNHHDNNHHRNTSLFGYIYMEIFK